MKITYSNGRPKGSPWLFQRSLGFVIGLVVSSQILYQRKVKLVAVARKKFVFGFEMKESKQEPWSVQREITGIENFQLFRDTFRGDVKLEMMWMNVYWHFEVSMQNPGNLLVG